MATYPVGTSTILPGNQSFAVVAAPGATTGATRLDHQGGNFLNSVRSSEYGASDSPWIRNIANKFSSGWTCTVAEDATTLESILAMGTRFDVYVKRSSGATTYDKIADALLVTQEKAAPEDGSAHRTIQVAFVGGVFSTGVAAGSVPTYT
jgi:hypothetical protein